MVQRKVPSKLSIQADHVKSSQKLLGSLRPSSPRYQDGKNRGADLKKKKMKKSRSIKRSDFGSPQSPSCRRNIPPPGRPPPPPMDDFLVITPTPRKHMSPNYMRSTSSFDAKKESQQVSSPNSPSSINKGKDSRKGSSSSKLGSGSGHKPTSSLKLVRALTKTTSFKPRASSTRKKCSQVILCEEDLDVQRATCSSTLKDSNFPAYLELNPGGTKLEGTSILKVCPYTYCSLNGHHHSPLSPLKCFLSARRRMLKTRKGMKLACLSPRQSKSSANGVKETAIPQIAIHEKPAIQVIEDHMEFFIEIYDKNGENPSDITSRSKQNGDDQDSVYFAINDFAPLAGTSLIAADQVDGQDVEKPSDEVLQSVIDFDDNCDKNSKPQGMKTDIFDLFDTEDPSADAAEEIHLPFMAQQEEISQHYGGNDTDLGAESLASNEDATDSEASDMEREEGPFEIPYLCEEAENLAQNSNKSEAEVGPSFENVPNSHGKDIFMLDDIVRSYFNEIPADEILEEFSGNDDQISVADSGSGDNFSESLVSYRSLGNEAFIDDVDSQSHGQIHLTSEMFVDKNAGRNATAHDLTIAASLQLEDDKTEPTSSFKDEAQIDPHNDECLGDSEASSLLGTSEFECPHDFDAQSLSNYVVEGQNQKEKNHDEAHPELNKVSVSEDSDRDVNEMELVSSALLDSEASFTSATKIVHTQTRTKFIPGERNPIQELPKNHYNLKIIRSKIPVEEFEESRMFNPREPNYLPVELDPEAEKVDLRHQMMDERKNSEEWMLDYALQRAVTKLAPARKQKVALLVEAFETVMPIPKYEPHLRHSSAAFAHPRPIQACS